MSDKSWGKGEGQERRPSGVLASNRTGLVPHAGWWHLAAAEPWLLGGKVWMVLVYLVVTHSLWQGTILKAIKKNKLNYCSEIMGTKKVETSFFTRSHMVKKSDGICYSWGDFGWTQEKNLSP